MTRTYADHLQIEHASGASSSIAKDFTKAEKRKKTKPSGYEKKVGDDIEVITSSLSGKKKADMSAEDLQVTSDEKKLLSPFTFKRKSKENKGGFMCPGSGGKVTDKLEGLPAAAVRKLGLSSTQVSKLYARFAEIDADNSNYIDVEEYISFTETTPSEFMKVLIQKMVFSITDLDGDNRLDFGEFVLASALISTFSTDQIFYLVFEVFDSNGNGFLEAKEFDALSKAVDELAGSMFPGNYTQFIAKFDRDSDGVIEFREFMDINDTFPMIFFPALRVQDMMRKKTLGVEKWKKITTNFNQNHAKSLREKVIKESKENRVEDDETSQRHAVATRASVPSPTSFYEQIMKLSMKPGAKPKKKKHSHKKTIDLTSGGKPKLR